MTLTGPRRAPTSGTAKTMVILLHGYGADGNDLIGLADPLAPHMPDTVFLAPNAPERCINNPMGYQWFPIPWLDGSTEEQAMQGMAASIDLLNAYLDTAAQEEGVAADQTVLIGFSQGTMMSLHVGLRRAQAFAGIIGFSGRLLAPERLSEITVKPPVLLIHGDQDEMVPPSSMPDAADALTGAGLEVMTHVSKGTGHGIAPDGLQMAFAALSEWLPKSCV
ncbi:alpha/beta hydrolase [Halovulum sp. GXIMD14793]